MNSPSVPKLLRQVRKALTMEDYAEAEELYETVLSFPEMQDDLDLRLRYAYCTDKNGNRDQAIDAYDEVLRIYRQQGEDAAATSVEKILEKLRSAPGEEQPSEQPVDEDFQPIDDATLVQQLCEMGELLTLQPGDMLCREGEMSEHLWLLQSGSLNVHLPDYEEPDLIEVIPGHLALVGELGFFTNQRRSAHVDAATTTTLFAIKTADIEQRQENDPAFRDAMDRLLLERWAEPVITRHSVFERVNDIDRMRIMKTFDRITMGPGETLIEHGEEHPYTYMLQCGCMFFMHSDETPDDSTVTDDGSLMTSIFPGDMIHLGGLLKGFKSEYKVVTATPVTLLRLSKEDFEPFTLRRPWIIQAIVNFSRRPANLQVMKPDDDYLWKANRHIKTH